MCFVTYLINNYVTLSEYYDEYLQLRMLTGTFSRVSNEKSIWIVQINSDAHIVSGPDMIPFQ